jgi:para-aminobenzoate synthetase / 4-amino-4-deoxychorismate lyase
VVPRIILDFPDGLGRPGRRFFHAPQRIVSTCDAAEIPYLLREVDADCAAGAAAIGFLAYEAAPAFDSAFRVHPPGSVPLMWFAVFEQEGRAAAVDAHVESKLSWQPDTTREQHAAAVQRIRDEIAAGTTYQVNYTVRMRGEIEDDALQLYESLRRAQGVGFHAFIETDEWCVISLSPELFFEIQGREINTRPMKGTRPRGRHADEDEALAHELRTSPKERAENLMIVDLMRNDLGRIAESGSVQVASLYDVEKYPTVLQMTSVVHATLRQDVDLAAVMKALFPPGSVTGAPKISTMKLIRELESSPRGIYCGAVGIVERNRAVFNVPIRTIWLDRRANQAEYGTGSGITADSQARDEYDELLTKTLVVSQPWPTFDLLETMRAEQGKIIRLDPHLDRLERSAEYFGFDLPLDEIITALDDALSRAAEPARVRLLLSEAGRARVEISALDELPEKRMVRLARTPISSRNRFLFHKTTHRKTYDLHLAEREDVFDVLLFNERDEITEFTRANVVLELNGELVTPARECGLLAGVFREALLREGRIQECIITQPQLAHASRIWWINSVREWVEVMLA